MAPFTASRYVIPSVFLCSEKKLCIWDILRFQWQTLSSHDSIRHRNGTSRSHTSNIAPEWFAKRGWWTKSQTSLLNIYFRLSGFQSSLLFIYFRYGSHLYGTVHTCSHCIDQSETTNPSDKWRSFFEIGAAQFRPVTETARLNHRSYVWKEAPPGVVFTLVQKLHVIVWPLEGNDMPAKHFVFHG